MKGSLRPFHRGAEARAEGHKSLRPEDSEILAPYPPLSSVVGEVKVRPSSKDIGSSKACTSITVVHPSPLKCTNNGGIHRIEQTKNLSRRILPTSAMCDIQAPAVVLKLDSQPGKFLCWMTERQQLLELEYVESIEIKEPGAWINVKINDRGETISYSELLDPYLTKANAQSAQIRCFAKTAPQEYARQHKKRRAVFNHRLGWAHAPLNPPELSEKLKSHPETSFEVIYCCILQNDYFLGQYKRIGSIWTVMELSADVTSTDPDLTARMPWEKQAAKEETVKPAQNTKLLLAPYVNIARDTGVNNNYEDTNKVSPYNGKSGPCNEVTLLKRLKELTRHPEFQSVPNRVCTTIDNFLVKYNHLQDAEGSRFF
uniref:Tudor domain-containing protein n=1 Tax=Steinernema glaseri TaxID=37863 RepID=A0A1I7YE20_9BILA